MTKYIIKLTEVATAENKGFKEGYTEIWYYGKEDHCLNRYHSSFDSWLVRGYGYDRECDAKKNWTYKNQNQLGYNPSWHKTVEIIKVEV